MIEDKVIRLIMATNLVSLKYEYAFQAKKKSKIGKKKTYNSSRKDITNAVSKKHETFRTYHQQILLVKTH